MTLVKPSIKQLCLFLSTLSKLQSTPYGEIETIDCHGEVAQDPKRVLNYIDKMIRNRIDSLKQSGTGKYDEAMGG